MAFFLVMAAKFYGNDPAKSFFSANDYISVYKAKAVNEMLIHGIPASITLAQGMLESANGNSDLAVNANNHFGIKCHKEWCGPTFTKDDDEKNECFRKYENVNESYNDHSMFLKTRSRYAFLFQLSKTDYAAWARGLKSAGYATHPGYAEKLIDLIERNRLFELDTIKILIEENFAKTEEKEKKNDFVLSAGTKVLVELIKKFNINSLKEERSAEAVSEHLKHFYLPEPENNSVKTDLVNNNNIKIESRISDELSPQANAEAKIEVKTYKIFTFSTLDVVREACYNYFTSINETNKGLYFFVSEKTILNCKNPVYTEKLFSCSTVKINTPESPEQPLGISLMKTTSLQLSNAKLYSENILVGELQILCNPIIW